jgi:hypothetical protein
MQRTALRAAADAERYVDRGQDGGKPVNSALRCIASLATLLAALLLTGAAVAQDFANRDSITVHGLVYIGALERATYGYDDSIRCQLLVANRSEYAVAMNVSVVYDAIHDLEAWCDTISALEQCTSPAPPISGWGDIEPFVLTPGEHVVASAALASRRPAGDTWDFWHGRVVFANPWNTTPAFTFSVSYRRERAPMVVSAASWTRVKQFYR